MRGLDPRISWYVSHMRGGWVYIMTNGGNNVIYTGVTAQLAQRANQHRCGLAGGFTAKYRLTKLVYYERHDEIIAAIQREKNIKHWPRAWKVKLIEDMNPNWSDLYLTLNM